MVGRLRGEVDKIWEYRFTISMYMDRELSSEELVVYVRLCMES